MKLRIYDVLTKCTLTHFTDFKFHMKDIIGGEGALVNPDGKHQYRNKGDKPFKMMYGESKERLSIGI